MQPGDHVCSTVELDQYQGRMATLIQAIPPLSRKHTQFDGVQGTAIDAEAHPLQASYIGAASRTRAGVRGRKRVVRCWEHLDPVVPSTDLVDVDYNSFPAARVPGLSLAEIEVDTTTKGYVNVQDQYLTLTEDEVDAEGLWESSVFFAANACPGDASIVKECEINIELEIEETTVSGVVEKQVRTQSVQLSSLQGMFQQSIQFNSHPVIGEVLWGQQQCSTVPHPSAWSNSTARLPAPFTTAWTTVKRAQISVRLV